ncbi:MAG: serine/threonine protein kinase [Chloroflexi bacterium]|nr:serine/threonine protein kinase [Chloroflexota bacterium]
MPTDFTGKTFGSYQLVAPLGRGGMASVYRGYQQSIDRSVAVKVLPPEFLHDPNFSARFVAEARTLARLTHPSILPLYDFGTANDVPYIIMPLMAHGTLAERLGRGPLANAELLRVLTPMASALDYAHTQGVLHRDVKPSNILFDQNDTPFLADFGIAKAVEATSGLTGTGVVGTPDYMSPEQARGEQLDGRSDNYALAVVAYQCLTGHALFKATTPMGVMLKHATEPPPPVQQARPDLPAAVDAVMQKSLSKRPADRYATAAEFVRALGASFVSVTSTARPPSRPPEMATVIERPATAARPTPAPLQQHTVMAPAEALAPPAQKKSGAGKWLILGSVIGVAAVLGVCVLGSGLLVGLMNVVSTSTPVPTDTPFPTETPIPIPTDTEVPIVVATTISIGSDLFYDDFSDPNSGWSTFSSDTGAAGYTNDEMSLVATNTDWFVWSTAPDTYSDIVVTVTATTLSTTDTTFGIMCFYQDSDNYNYLALDATGRYAILRYDSAGDTWLTSGGDWATSPYITPYAGTYSLGATCGNGMLELYVDGTLIDSAFDSTFTSGQVGVFVWSGKQGNAEVAFDDFVVMSLLP